MPTWKKRIFICFLISIFLELFVFNFKHWESYFFPTLDGYHISVGEGLEQTGEHEYRVKDLKSAYFEITDINGCVKNIHADIRIKELYTRRNWALPVRIDMTDAANSMYRSLPRTEIARLIKESEYIRLHLIGDSTKLRLWIAGGEQETIVVNDLQLNVRRPFLFNPIRVMALVLVGCLYLIFNHKSVIYRWTLDFADRRQRRLTGALLTLHLLMIGLTGVSALPFVSYQNDTWRAHAQYEELADALIDGHFYLNEEPAKSLKQMENPYDSTLRAKVTADAGESFLFDFAYFNGKYYCYFGVVPALLFFVPFQLITGQHLQTWIPVLLCGLLYGVAAFYFIYQMIRKYLKQVSFGMYLLMASVYTTASSILYLVHFGNVYSMPIMLGLLLGVFGLSLWLRTVGADGELDKRYLVGGAVSIALVMGCRPQLAIVMLFAFPIFWEEIKERKFFSKKGMGNTCCVILPFLVVGCLLMYYNYARFGSPFDFGANYNLTSNDMTHKGFVFSRNFLGLFEYFLQPFHVKATFPFLEVVSLTTEYQGYLSTEPLFGGFLWFHLITVFSFGIFRCRKKLQSRNLWGIALMALISAFIVVEVNIQMSGLTQRYMSDFGWLFALPAILVVCSLEEDLQNGEQRLYRVFMRTVIWLSVGEMALNYYSVFLDGRYAELSTANPYMYYLMKYLFFKC